MFFLLLRRIVLITNCSETFHKVPQTKPIVDSLLSEITGCVPPSLLKNESVMSVFLVNFSAGIYQFKVNNANISIMYEICSKLVTKAIEQRCHLRCSGDFIVNFEHILHIIL